MENNKNIKFGLVPPVPGTDVKGLIQFARDCEEAGFESNWFPDHMLFMANRITPEVWSVITGASVLTKKIHLGAIGDPHRIHPAVFAHRLATIDNMSAGRVFSCLGYGEKMNLDYYGIPWNKPLSRLRESVEIIKALLKGEVVNFEGDFFKLQNAEIRIRPHNGRSVPIYIAATGPKALSLAGEMGDGWITNAMPDHLYSKKLGTVNESLKKRETKPEFERAIYIFLSISGDYDDAYKTLDSIKHAIIWPELLEEAGYDIEIDDKFNGLEYTKIMPNDKEMIEKFREMGSEYYSREILENFVICGTPGDARSTIERYIDAGVDHFVLRDFSPDKEYSFEVLSKEILPFFKN